MAHRPGAVEEESAVSLARLRGGCGALLGMTSEALTWTRYERSEVVWIVDVMAHCPENHTV